jgi:hypothetical protein
VKSWQQCTIEVLFSFYYQGRFQIAEDGAAVELEVEVKKWGLASHKSS